MVFEDRVAKYPGRWTMVKSDGTSEIVTLIRNDEPTKEGTPINAATLNELSTVAGAINAKEEAVSAAQAAASERAKAEQAAANAANAVKVDLKEYSDKAVTSASNAAESEKNAKASETESAKNLQGTKEYFEQVRTITIGAQGWYATPEALKTAVPVGENGWWAVVGTTDTIWTWDGDTGAWKDSVQKADLSDYYTREQVNRLLEAQKLADHPVCSIYQTVSHVSPASIFGGIWEEIAQGRTLMGATDAQIGGITVEAGLPNITGSLTAPRDGENYSPFRGSKAGLSKSGALKFTEINASWCGYSQSSGSTYNIEFDASSSNSIYGRSSTVQPPAYIVHIWERMGYLLNIYATAGSSLTITDGKTTVKDIVDDSGHYSRELPSTGTWTITVSKDGNVHTKTRVVDTYGVYIVDTTIEIFGVVWNYGNSSTALTRLTRQSDPYSFVTTNITSEPVPAVGTSYGTSPFDKYMPWKGMEEYNIVNNTVGVKQEEQGFSRANDTVVFVPDFYYKVVDDASGKKRYFYVANKKESGFEKHPGSGRYVGRYNTASGYVSKTGLAPLTNITRATARTNSMAKGSGWYEYDYASWCAIGLLYIVEFADWNTQSKIGKGNSSNSSVESSGGTDSMTYHTGRASGADGASSVQYRHIENPWGNVFDWVDGINFSGSIVYVCTDPAKYVDSTSTGYTNAGTRASSGGYISALGASTTAPWAFYPSSTRGSEATYIPDYMWTSSDWLVLGVGGCVDNNSNAGMFCFGSDHDSSFSNGKFGARLMFVPSKY